VSTPEGSEPSSIRRFLSVAEPANKSTPYAVLTDYPESDPKSAVGQVYRFELDGGKSKATSVLSTNDNLATIWASPEGNLWIGTALGNVWTTAAVNWDASAIDGLDWEQVDPDYQWKAIELPLRPDESICRVTALWGSSDSDIHASTREGKLLHWNGKTWSHSYVEGGFAIQAVHGSAPDNVWAVGRRGVVLHYNGKGWRRAGLPQGYEREDLSGVWVTAEKVHICSSGGAVFRGDAKELSLIGNGPDGFHGIAELDGVYYLAAGKRVCSLRGDKMHIEGEQLTAAGVFRLNQRVAFVETQQDVPSLVIHDPANIEQPWIGCKAR
jgi:hypothetical protein